MRGPTGPSSERWFAPLLRFGRVVLLLDLALGIVVAALSIWRGWTSVAESSTAIIVGGVVLAGLGALPAVGPVLGALQPTQMQIPWRFPDMANEDRAPGVLRVSALLVTAGLLAIAYGVAVKTLFA